jgi:hypothetical protein
MRITYAGKYLELFNRQRITSVSRYCDDEILADLGGKLVFLLRGRCQNCDIRSSYVFYGEIMNKACVKTYKMRKITCSMATAF